MSVLDAADAADEGRRYTVGQLLDAVGALPAASQGDRLRELTDDDATILLVEDMLLTQTRHLSRDVAPLSRMIAGLGDTELHVGDVLGAWRLSERLASGGMGTVFVAERDDQLYRQRVAIKLLRGTDPATARTMAAERQLLAQLQHPGIARLYDGGTTPGGQPYLVMEYVDGVPLDRYCRERQPDLRARIVLFQRICHAVEAAHRQLVVHCDLKPGNVLVQSDGAPVLLDFGIARALGAGDSPAPFCTPAYASPELLAGAHVSTVSDVYSLGVLLTELLADRRPPRDAADPKRPLPFASALADAEGTPWRRQLAGDLDAIAAKACAPDPASRYASVAALDEDLSRYLAHRPVGARGAAPGYRAGRLLRRRWREAAALALVAMLSTVFVWRLDDERTRAQRSAETAERVSDLLVGAFEAADPKFAKAGEPSARDVLDAGAARLDQAGVEDLEVLARLRQKLGAAYQNLGQPRRAEPLLLAAVEGYLDPGVEQPLQAAAVLSALAVLRANDDNDQAGVEAARRSLLLRERAGAGPLEIADSLNSLGLALVDVDAAEAQTVLGRALVLRRERLGEPSEQVAATLHNLAQLQRHRGDQVAAESLYRQALSQKRAMGGEQSGSYGLSLAGLAMSVRAQGRLQEAAVLQREILQRAQRMYRDGSNLGDAHNELANTLHDLGEWEQAAAHYLEAARLAAAASGEDSVDHAVNLNNQASLDEDRGALAQAEEGFRRSLAIRTSAQGADSPSVLRARFNLGRLLLRQQRVREAGAVIQPAWDIWQRTQPESSPNTVGFRLTVAEWLLASGRLEDVRTQVRALSAPDIKLPPKRRAALLALQGALAERQGDGRGAEALRGQALAVIAEEFGADHVESAKYRLAHAQALLAAGDRRQALLQLASAEAVLRPRLVPQAPLVMQMDALAVQLRSAALAVNR
jgi:serine/threonine-protein kinase